jgi:hypothetical protein
VLRDKFRTGPNFFTEMIFCETCFSSQEQRRSEETIVGPTSHKELTCVIIQITSWALLWARPTWRGNSLFVVAYVYRPPGSWFGFITTGNHKLYYYFLLLLSLSYCCYYYLYLIHCFEMCRILHLYLYGTMWYDVL